MRGSDSCLFILLRGWSAVTKAEDSARNKNSINLIQSTPVNKIKRNQAHTQVLLQNRRVFVYMDDTAVDFFSGAVC